MGNKGSSESVSVSLPQREDNHYEALPSRSGRLPHAVSLPPPLNTVSSSLHSSTVVLPSSSSPSIHSSLPAGRLHDRRSMTIVHRPEKEQKSTSLSFRRQSSSDASSSSSFANDQLQSHIVTSNPTSNEEEVGLGGSIVVHFDRDVKTVNIKRLFEVKQAGSTELVNGSFIYDSKQLCAEFTPAKTLYPNTVYTVTLFGRAVTTTQCSVSKNIHDAHINFQTCAPPTKWIGIKIKGQKNEAEKMEISTLMYYDLLNSLISWSARHWGCSGEHVRALFVENDERGKTGLHQLKVDHDVLDLRGEDVVVVDLKD